jgi:hypothetical protein
MPEFPPFAPSPARVHENARAHTGHHPHWEQREYRGGLFRTDHFRTCSYCGCIHPADLAELLEAGQSWLEECGKPEKRLLMTPNPVAGELVSMGSSPGPVFRRDVWPMTLKDKLLAPAAPDLCPSMGERLAGHFERPLLEPAPRMIPQPIFQDHMTERFWGEILVASARGENNASLPRT